MVEADINRDLFKIKKPVMFGMTLRQLLGAVAAGAGLLIGFFGVFAKLPMDLRIILSVFPALPGALMGFVPLLGTTFEKGIIMLIQDALAPKRRFFKIEDEIFKEIPNPLPKGEKKAKPSRRKEYRPVL